LVFPNRRSPAVAFYRCKGLVSACAVLLASLALGEVKKPRIGKDTPEGTFLELVSLEATASKKVALLEHFLTIFPACDPSITVWVYGELQDRYGRAGELDKALGAGEKIMALQPDNIEIAAANRRIAEKKGNADLARKWSDETAAIAERLVKSPLPLPLDPEESKIVQDRMDYARQFVVKINYDEFNKAIQIKEPAERIAALEEFLKKAPQNPYFDQIEVAEFLAYKEIGDVDKTLAAAEKILSHNENREDALLFVLEINYRRKKDSKRTLALAAKFIERMTVAEKPEGVSDLDWTRAKNQNIARAHYITGRIYFDSGQWPPADRALRATLPLIGDEQFRAAVLNDLGWANYQMQNAIDAIKFYSECAAIKSPLQEQAAKSAVSVKAEYHLQ
jgi:tetratricopeptide (TPR) repeat protein